MTEPGTRIVYEFDEFRLDLQQRLLLSGADGRPIPLSPKIFDTLLYFVERRGELLDKTTLMKAIWPNIVVEENSLNQNISALRRALGESPGEHRFIVTEPGRGYRFVAEVRTLTIPARTSAQQQPAAEASTALSTSQPKTASTSRSSIAVLPFANLTGDPGKEYFSDGMAEELIHVLARVPGLRVPSRTSSFAYKRRDVDLRQIARDLQVNTVLEGSVRSAGERIRVTAQLIDGETGYHLWSENYDRQFADLFQLQEELATAIVQALRVTLDGQMPVGANRERPTRDLEAYELYLQAIAMQGTGIENVPHATDMLQRAIARDPTFARAYSALADIRAFATAMDFASPGTVADAEREVSKALALDPSLGAAHAALGTIYASQGRWIESEQRYRQSFALDASDPAARQSYGLILQGSVGCLQHSLDSILEAHRLAPAWIGNLMVLGAAYLLVGKSDECARYLEMANRLGLPRIGAPVSDLFATLALDAGRYDEATQIMVDSLTPPLRAAGGEDVVRGVYAALVDSSKRRGAVEALDGLRARIAPDSMVQFARRRFMVWYTQLGAISQAFEVANESLDLFAAHGTIGIAWGFLWMPAMLPYRQDPRFQAFAARLNLFEHWNQYGPPDDCELRNGKLICR